MSQEEQVVFNLDINTSRGETSFRKLETVMYRALGLYNRICRLLGIPEDSPMTQIVNRAQQLVMLARQLTTAVTLVESASGPVGWALAGIGVAGVGLSSIEFMQSTGE